MLTSNITTNLEEGQANLWILVANTDDGHSMQDQMMSSPQLVSDFKILENREISKRELKCIADQIIHFYRQTQHTDMCAMIETEYITMVIINQ